LIKCFGFEFSNVHNGDSQRGNFNKPRGDCLLGYF
jgi:hypothetical protein